MGRKRNRTRSRTDSGGTISRRTLMLLLGGGTVGATGYLVSGASDSVEADRFFGVRTANDNAAMLGIDLKNPSGTHGETVTLMELTNQFANTLDSISAAIVPAMNAPLNPGSIQTPQQLAPGETGVIQADLVCGTARKQTVDVAIEASNAEESVELVRSVPVSCTGVDTGVCAPRSVSPGCTQDTIPEWGSTDCSIVIHTTGKVREYIAGGVDIGGAVDVDTDDQVDIGVRGGATIAEYLRVVTPAEINFDISGGASIGDVVQFDTQEDVSIDVRSSIGGGLCVKNGNEIDASVKQGGHIDGTVSLTSNDSVSLDLSGNASTGAVQIDAPDGSVEVDIKQGSTIDGSLGVDSSGSVDIGLSGNELIRGDISVDTDEEVEIELSGSSTFEGDISITTNAGVDLALTGNSTIEGDVTITTEDPVEIEFTGSSTIEGDVTIDTDDEIDISDCTAILGCVSPKSACSDSQNAC